MGTYQPTLVYGQENGGLSQPPERLFVLTQYLSIPVLSSLALALAHPLLRFVHSGCACARAIV